MKSSFHEKENKTAAISDDQSQLKELIDNYNVLSTRIGLVGKPPSFMPQALYRGDTRDFNQVFNDGFHPRGTNTDLLTHASPPYGRDYFNNSAFISTSTSKKVATTFPQTLSEGIQSTCLYEIRSDRSTHNIFKELKPKWTDGDLYLLLKHEKERAFVNRIYPEEIKSCRKIDINPFDSDSRKVNREVIPNPNYSFQFQAEQKIFNIAKSAGYLLTGVGAGIDGFSLYQHYQHSETTGNYDNTYREASRITGGWSGAWAGGVLLAEGGASLGTPFGPYGIAIGGMIGGFTGSGLGYFGGSEIATTIYNTVTNMYSSQESKNMNNRSTSSTQQSSTSNEMKTAKCIRFGNAYNYSTNDWPENYEQKSQVETLLKGAVLISQGATTLGEKLGDGFGYLNQLRQMSTTEINREIKNLYEQAKNVVGKVVNEFGINKASAEGGSLEDWFTDEQQFQVQTEVMNIMYDANLTESEEILFVHAIKNVFENYALTGELKEVGEVKLDDNFCKSLGKIYQDQFGELENKDSKENKSESKESNKNSSSGELSSEQKKYIEQEVQQLNQLAETIKEAKEQKVRDQAIQNFAQGTYQVGALCSQLGQLMAMTGGHQRTAVGLMNVGAGLVSVATNAVAVSSAVSVGLTNLTLMGTLGFATAGIGLAIGVVQIGMALCAESNNEEGDGMSAAFSALSQQIQQVYGAVIIVSKQVAHLEKTVIEGFEITWKQLEKINGNLDKLQYSADYVQSAVHQLNKNLFWVHDEIMKAILSDFEINFEELEQKIFQSSTVNFLENDIDINGYNNYSAALLNRLTSTCVHQKYNGYVENLDSLQLVNKLQDSQTATYLYGLLGLVGDIAKKASTNSTTVTFAPEKIINPYMWGRVAKTYAEFLHRTKFNSMIRSKVSEDNLSANFKSISNKAKEVIDFLDWLATNSNSVIANLLTEYMTAQSEVSSVLQRNIASQEAHLSQNLRLGDVNLSDILQANLEEKNSTYNCMIPAENVVDKLKECKFDEILTMDGRYYGIDKSKHVVRENFQTEFFYSKYARRGDGFYHHGTSDPYQPQLYNDYKINFPKYIINLLNKSNLLKETSSLFLLRFALLLNESIIKKQMIVDVIFNDNQWTSSNVHAVLKIGLKNSEEEKEICSIDTEHTVYIRDVRLRNPWVVCSESAVINSNKTTFTEQKELNSILIKDIDNSLKPYRTNVLANTFKELIQVDSENKFQGFKGSLLRFEIARLKIEAILKVLHIDFSQLNLRKGSDYYQNLKSQSVSGNHHNWSDLVNWVATYRPNSGALNTQLSTIATSIKTHPLYQRMQTHALDNFKDILFQSIEKNEREEKLSSNSSQNPIHLNTEQKNSNTLSTANSQKKINNLNESIQERYQDYEIYRTELVKLLKNANDKFKDSDHVSQARLWLERTTKHLIAIHVLMEKISTAKDNTTTLTGYYENINDLFRKAGSAIADINKVLISESMKEVGSRIDADIIPKGSLDKEAEDVSFLKNNMTHISIEASNDASTERKNIPNSSSYSNNTTSTLFRTPTASPRPYSTSSNANTTFATNASKETDDMEYKVVNGKPMRR